MGSNLKEANVSILLLKVITISENIMNGSFKSKKWPGVSIWSDGGKLWQAITLNVKLYHFEEKP